MSISSIWFVFFSYFPFTKWFVFWLPTIICCTLCTNYNATPFEFYAFSQLRLIGSHRINISLLNSEQMIVVGKICVSMNDDMFGLLGVLWMCIGDIFPIICMIHGVKNHVSRDPKVKKKCIKVNSIRWLLIFRCLSLYLSIRHKFIEAPLFPLASKCLVYFWSSSCMFNFPF